MARDARIATIVTAVGLVGIYALAAYLLLSWTVASGLVSITFLLVLPVALAALLGYLTDRQGEQPLGHYMRTAGLFSLVVLVTSVVVLREGTICILMLLPLWMPLLFLGTWLSWRLRRQRGDGRTYCASFLLLPLAAMAIEPSIPRPVTTSEVSRSRIVSASPERLWPLLEGIDDVKAGEGRWNLSQDLVGVPRPVGARLVGSGLGATRLARWEHGIAFRERITEWRPGRALGWTFHFDDFRGWEMADRHLLPDGPDYRVTSGGYRLEPLGDGRTRVTLTTRYVMATPVNAYAAWWGEFFLGDLHDNLLALIAGRAQG